jgi:hypothetical protein
LFFIGVGNECYVVTITSNIQTYLTSEDEMSLLVKTDAARALLKRKLEMYDAKSKGSKDTTSKTRELPNK